jgi:hypothetical protein
MLWQRLMPLVESIEDVGVGFSAEKKNQCGQQ